jgi:FkbM family methyltransferase
MNHFLKRTLRSIFSHVACPIFRGSLRGYRWLLGSGGKLARFIFGGYESASTARFGDLIAPGDTVFDIGAHFGYYTLLASKQVGPEGRVVAFEPQPRNAHFLRRHLDLNGCENVVVEEMAISDSTGTVRFEREGSATGHLAARGELEVRTINLDSYVAETGDHPDVMKIDVEGAEALLLTGGQATLEELRPRIMLATHDLEVDARCRDLLGAAGYAIEDLASAGRQGGVQMLCRPPRHPATSERISRTGS